MEHTRRAVLGLPLAVAAGRLAHAAQQGGQRERATGAWLKSHPAAARAEREVPIAC